jgi:hypothetical protein
VKLYKDRYAVSPCGHVFDKKRGRFLTHYSQSVGYVQVLIHSKKEYLHKVVSQCYPIIFENEAVEVDHLDGNKTNNCFLNLEQVTKSTNIKRSFLNGQNRTPPERIKLMVSNRKKAA